MYITNLKFRSNIDDNLLVELKGQIAAAFNNRCGSVLGKEISKYELVYESKAYPPYSLGIMALTENKELIENLIFWDWNDTDNPKEYTDVLEDMKKW